MTLSFSTKWPAKMGDLAGQPNYFIEKIHEGLFHHGKEQKYNEHAMEHKIQFGKYWDAHVHENQNIEIDPKIHTLRSGNRWKAGMKIHPVINNRTKNRFQFAPDLECKSVQVVQIKHAFPHRYIFIDGKYIDDYKTKLEIALNDGFPSVDAFFRWFDDGVYQLIHWTDLKY